MTSRYDDGRRVWVDTPSRGRVLAVHLPPIQWNSYPYTKYQVVEGDTLPLLAHNLYRDATQYWLIAEMNPHIAAPDDLHYGDVLYIPSRGV